MYFLEDDVQKLKVGYAEMQKKYEDTLISFQHHPYKQQEAKEFATHGFTRRIGIMKRCVDNIYKICPPTISHNPDKEELNDLAINLQTFFVNVYGSLDNLAWVWVKEKGILKKEKKPLPNIQIGFTKKYTEVRKSFSVVFQDYLATLDKWLNHVENFRHSLAHRIPLYVPPRSYNNEESKIAKELKALSMVALRNAQFEESTRLEHEIETLGKFEPLITHSFSENSAPVAFHPQIIVDWNTVIEISEHFLAELNK